MNNKSILKNIMWTLITVIIGVLTVMAVMNYTKGFSFNDALILIKNGNKKFIYLSMALVILYIYLEGAALKRILRYMNVKINNKQAFLYSAADVYFSAITPSASGGQPASFYFMRKDGISFSKSTMALVFNLLMYSFAIDFIGVLCFVARLDIFFRFNIYGRFLIVIGFLVMSTLTVVFFMLLKESKWIEKLGLLGIKILGKLHIIKNVTKKREKLARTIKKYNDISNVALKNNKMLVEVFLINLAQRAIQISITVFVYIGLGGSFKRLSDVWFSQAFAVIGSNSAPIPGAQGVADYLMLQGFSNFMNEELAVHTELLSRGISFYVCITISLIVSAIGYFKVRKVEV